MALGEKQAKLGNMVAAGLVALLFCGLAACKKPEAAARGQTVKVERRTLQSVVTASGAIRPQVGADVKVGPRVSGLLKRLYAKVGDTVKAGQVLAELEHTDLDAAVRDAQAAVNEAKARLDLDRSILARRERLAKDGIISSEDLEVAGKNVAVDQASLESAESRLALARITQGYATVAAPISGTVTVISTQEGETVAASFAVPTFVTIVDLSRLQVEAYVDEVDIGRVKPGQNATFTVDAAPSESFEGNVQAVVPQAMVRNNVVNYVVLLAIEKGRKELLRPEMTASVSIETGERREALVVPAAAVQYDGQGSAYVTVMENGKPQKRTIACGSQGGAEIPVKEGLAEGEEVLLPEASGETSR
jgi:RND family efflux transporter MFP subunit